MRLIKTTLMRDGLGHEVSSFRKINIYRNILNEYYMLLWSAFYGSSVHCLLPNTSGYIRPHRYQRQHSCNFSTMISVLKKKKQIIYIHNFQRQNFTNIHTDLFDICRFKPSRIGHPSTINVIKVIVRVLYARISTKTKQFKGTIQSFCETIIR